jgi:hypothetical protein
MTALTARALAKSYAKTGKVPGGVYVTSPYSGAMLLVTGAHKNGCRHITLETERGDVIVDESQKLTRRGA